MVSNGIILMEVVCCIAVYLTRLFGGNCFAAPNLGRRPPLGTIQTVGVPEFIGPSSWQSLFAAVHATFGSLSCSCKIPEHLTRLIISPSLPPPPPAAPTRARLIASALITMTPLFPAHQPSHHEHADSAALR